MANADDEIGEAFLSEKPIDQATLKAAVHRATLSHRFVPVLVGSALRNRGVQLLLDAIVDYLPNPGEVTYHALNETSGEPQKVLLKPQRTDENPFLGLAFKLEVSNVFLNYIHAFFKIIRAHICVCVNYSFFQFCCFFGRFIN
ncbi:unnamed protein product [Trichobilharzia regenti]|nr:unnamed protein product [Trichobilharzia regenti]